MSKKAITFIRDTYKEESVAKKFLLIMIASRCNDDGFCCPAISIIADDCCVSTRYVQRIIGQLLESGDLSIEYNCGVKTSHGYTNVYYLRKYRQRYNLNAVAQLGVQS